MYEERGENSPSGILIAFLCASSIFSPFCCLRRESADKLLPELWAVRQRRGRDPHLESEPCMLVQTQTKTKHSFTCMKSHTIQAHYQTQNISKYLITDIIPISVRRPVGGITSQHLTERILNLLLTSLIVLDSLFLSCFSFIHQLQSSECASWTPWWGVIKQTRIYCYMCTIN